MTQRWKTAGWVCVALCVVFAAVALALAFQDGGTQTFQIGIAFAQNPIVAQSSGVLRSVVFGVLAGVAFFTGLACFFWSAVVEARQQRAEIIRLLSAGTGGD